MNVFSKSRYFLREEFKWHAKRLLRLPTAAGNWSHFWRDYGLYRSQAGCEEILVRPYIEDRTSRTEIDPDYFYQDSWAFERILKHQHEKHVDIGSHHRFVALLSKAVDTTMVDIRPLSLPLDSLKFVEGSILEMPFENESSPSISSICVVEHIGLGRYGDPLDPEGSVKAVRELIRILAPSGHPFLSVPIDDADRTYFNGQRAFTEETFLELCQPLVLEDRAYIFGKEYGSTRQTGFGIGCYEFVKLG